VRWKEEEEEEEEEEEGKITKEEKSVGAGGLWYRP
jgi:hypothetical protein